MLFTLVLPFPVNMAKPKGLKFSADQKKFIIDEFLKNKKATEVKRSFRQQFGQSKALMNTGLGSFQNVFDLYKKGGAISVGISKPKEKPKSKVNQETLSAVKAHFEANRNSSVREAAREIGVSKSTAHTYVKVHLQMKPYKASKHLILSFFC